MEEWCCQERQQADREKVPRYYGISRYNHENIRDYQKLTSDKPSKILEFKTVTEAFGAYQKKTCLDQQTKTSLTVPYEMVTVSHLRVADRFICGSALSGY